MTAAQTLTAGTGITITDIGGGGHTIDATGLVSINADTTPDQILIAGVGIAITDDGVGNHTIDATGLISINTDTTQDQFLSAGDGITITDDGLGDHNIATTAILAINADTTQAQTLTGDSHIDIADDMAGGHAITLTAVWVDSSTVPGVPVNVPVGATTPLVQIVVPSAGVWYFTGNTNTNAPLPGNINALVQIDNGGSFIGEDCHLGAITTNISVISHSVVSYLINCGGAEVITLSMLQDSAAAVDVNATLQAIRIGNL